MRISLCLAFVCLFALPVQDLDAGVLYARRPGTESPLYTLNISRIRTNVRIVGQLAVTHVDEEFFNDNNQVLEGFYAFTLPEGASVDGLWLWVDGNRLRFIVKRIEEAERLYDSVVVGQRRDPAILESLGRNRFQLKVFPINPHSSRRIEMRYFHPIPMTTDGFVHYRYPLNTKTYQSVPVQTTDLRIDVESHLPILEFHSNFDDRPLLNRVIQFSDRAYRIDFGTENQVYAEDYELRFKPAESFSLFPALSWRDPDVPEGDPYFICWHPVTDQRSVAGRDLIFVLDGSGSMAGQRIEAVSDAMHRLLPVLNPDDRFRIVLFGSYPAVSPTDVDFYDVTPENVTKALAFMDTYYQASGGTNYEGALKQALSVTFRPDREARMLFLTDGEPTAGDRTLDGLLATITRLDTHGVRIFPVIFYSPSIDLLDEIARARGGKITLVEAGDDLGTVISRIMIDLQVSGITNPVVEYLERNAFLVFPRSFPTVVSLDKLLTTGRTVAQHETARLTVNVGPSETRSFTHEMEFGEWETDLPQVGSYWASKRIDDLLEEIRVNGRTDELVESVVALSMKHQLLSPYTAFLVLETNEIDPTGVDRLRSAPSEFTLHQNYPNPFSRSMHARTQLRYDVKEEMEVQIVVTDMLGRVLRVLVHSRQSPGTYTATWDGRDASGAPVPAGCYIVRMSGQGGNAFVKLLLTE